MCNRPETYFLQKESFLTTVILTANEIPQNSKFLACNNIPVPFQSDVNFLSYHLESYFLCKNVIFL